MREAVEILSKMVRMKSDECEAEVVGYLADRFEAAGIPYTRQEVAGPGRENIVATIGDGEPSLLFNSHIDTVGIGDPQDWTHRPFGAEIENGYMFGRGSADAKGSLAAMVAAFETLRRELDPASGRVVLTAVAGEETMGIGTAAAVADGIRCQAAIVGEPTNLEVCIAHKGVLRSNITVHGIAAHSSEPWEGRNAIIDMQEVIAGLQALSERVAARSDSLLGSASLAVTLIQGGIARNVIPPRCTISIDRRMLPAENPNDVRQEIDNVLDVLSGRIEISVEPVSVAEAANTPVDSKIVEIALDARSTELGFASEARGFSACCDMWHLANTAGMPTIILGPGSLSQAHKTDEHVAVEEVERAADLYRRIALDWLRSPT